MRRTALWLAPALLLGLGLAGRAQPPAPPPAKLSVSGASLVEGDEGDAPATFLVTLDAPAPRPVTVVFTTRDGTALAADGDYRPVTGTLTFTPGMVAAEVEVPVLGDTVEEPDEIFFLELAEVSGAEVAAGRAEGEILDDDGAAGPGEGPVLSIEDAEIGEGDVGRRALRFTVELSAPVPVPVTVDVATADASAVAGEDYLAAVTELRFAPGTTSRSFQVSVLGDRLEEGDEDLVVGLANPVNAVLERELALGLILDDDAPGAITVEPVSALERQARPGQMLAFQVRVRSAAGEPIPATPVAWAVDGVGELLDGAVTVTDERGIATQRVLLGSGPGRLAVRAETGEPLEELLFQVVVNTPPED